MRASAKRGCHAAFSYSCEQRFAAVTKPAIIIATASPLLDPSRAAAALIRGSELQELTDVQAPAMETGAKTIAAAALARLDH